MQDLAAAEGREDFKKIKYTCEQALRDGITYVWIDTCCIDKRSSAELSEAINSMFAYYKQARKCYVYLQDVPADCPALKDGRSSGRWLRIFQDSRWFQRGWTLQELLAAKPVEFYNAGWGLLGSLNDVVASVAQRTRIDIDILLKARQLKQVSIAQRMSWASGRETTRVEDRAYSLLGIFEVNMALIYGEGQKAFKRLQEEILKKTTDQTLFAWGYYQIWPLGMPLGMFADSPDDFEYSHDFITGDRYNAEQDAMELTNVGIHINLLVLRFEGFYFGILNCRLQDRPELYLALYLEHPGAAAPHVFQVAATLPPGQQHPKKGHSWRVYVIDMSHQRQYATETRALLLHERIWIELGLTHEKLPLWVQIAPTCPLEIIDAFPADQWNIVAGTMTPGDTGGLGPALSGTCMANFSAVVLRDRNAHHRRKTLCFGLVGNIPATVVPGYSGGTITWNGFVDDIAAEQACSRLTTRLNARLRSGTVPPQGVTLWEDGDFAVRVEQVDEIDRYKLFELRFEHTGGLLLQPREIPLLIRFNTHDTGTDC
ncbi:hypothetical protein LTR17_019426 [Elasticomyces elasticus]|nr:hypothetical protein LTR17_019426 [Elasticomyces elasticus]